MSAKIISFANQKGGVGKTTTTSEVGEILAKYFHKKVLMIDLDPQASLTSIKYDMHKLLEEKMTTMTQVMMDENDIDDIILNIKPNLDLAPANLTLSDAELTLVNVMSREQVLNQAMEEMDNEYDYILIDCPPNRGVLTVNALTASDYVCVPVQAEYQAFLGMQLLKNTIKSVKRKINPSLKVLGYCITMTSHTNHSNENMQVIKDDEYPTLISIPRSIDVADASVSNMSTYEYRKDNKAGKMYYEFSKKLNDLGE